MLFTWPAYTTQNESYAEANIPHVRAVWINQDCILYNNLEIEYIFLMPSLEYSFVKFKFCVRIDKIYYDLILKSNTSIQVY